MKRQEMTITKILLVTLLPSAVMTAIYLIAGFYMQTIPALDLFFIVAILTLFPFEVWVILSANKREFGSYGLHIAFTYHEKMKWWKILLYAIGLFGFAGIVSVTIAPLENHVMNGISDHLYSGLPAYFNWNDFEFMKQYPKGLLVFTCILYVVMNVLICPVIEELYFRGYLTAKLKRFGRLAPIIVAIVFSLYHWWLPFNNIFRIVIFSIVASITYKKKNLFISIAFHCMCNLFSTISFMLALMN